MAALAVPPLERAGGLDAAFLFLAGISAAGALAGALVLRGHAREPRDAAAAPWTMRDRRLWTLSLASGLYMVAQVALTGFLVLFLHDERGFSSGSAAAVLAVANALVVVARVARGRWSDKVRARVVPLRWIGSRSSPRSFCPPRHGVAHADVFLRVRRRVTADRAGIRLASAARLLSPAWLRSRRELV